MKRLSFDLVAAGVVFLAVIIVPLVVTTVLTPSSSDTALAAPAAHSETCYWDWDPVLQIPVEICNHTPHTPVPPTATFTWDPCDDLLSPPRFDCDPPTPEPTATDPPPPPTATDLPEPTATDPPEPTATDPPPTATDPPPTADRTATAEAIEAQQTAAAQAATAEAIAAEQTAAAQTATAIAAKPTATPVPLDAPVLTSVGDVLSITLSWTHVTNADEYRVQEKRSMCSRDDPRRCEETWWYPLHTATVHSSHGYTVTGLTSDRTYTHRVCSHRDLLNGTWQTACSSEETSRPNPEPPPVPPTATPQPTATPGALLDQNITVTLHAMDLTYEWIDDPNADAYAIETSECHGPVCRWRTVPWILPDGTSVTFSIWPDSVEERIMSRVFNTTYGVRIRSYRNLNGSTEYSRYSTTRYFTVGLPHRGHQDDGTVEYRIGSIASDLRIVFDYALNDAVSEWNSVVGQHLVFCEQPCSNNHDNATTVIDTVSDEVTPGKGSTSGGGACGAAIACHVSRTAAHLGDSRVIIEEPAYEYSADKAKHYRAIWTNDPG